MEMENLFLKITELMKEKNDRKTGHDKFSDPRSSAASLLVVVGTLSFLLSESM